MRWAYGMECYNLVRNPLTVPMQDVFRVTNRSLRFLLCSLRYELA
jgi:hypothetical protein